MHPDTGKTVFAPFRFSAFVPINIPLVRALTVIARAHHCARFRPDVVSLALHVFR